MGSSLFQLIVLAGIAILVILKLRSILGTRDGFENPHVGVPERTDFQRKGLQVYDGGNAVDKDISKFVEPDSKDARNLAAMKRTEEDFSVADFMAGARYAYEMIVTAFAKGELEDIKPYLSDDVFQSFSTEVSERSSTDISDVVIFQTVSDVQIESTYFESDALEAEITIKFTGKYLSREEDEEGTEPYEFLQSETWTFARTFGTGDPNWQLVETTE